MTSSGVPVGRGQVIERGEGEHHQPSAGVRRQDLVLFPLGDEAEPADERGQGEPLADQGGRG